MRARKLRFHKLLCLAFLASLGTAEAAAPFNPDLVNTSTYEIQPVGYVGSPVASGYVLTRGQQVLYMIDYNSQDWSGNLRAFNISTTGNVATTENWNAGTQITTQAQNYNTARYIVTIANGAGVGFRWGNLTPSQKSALDPATAANAGATTSPILDYIRGQRANEAPNGLKYRPRPSTNIMGDVIHATPRVWHDGTNRTVFVGANDGMLHAINAANGTERFAYVPAALLPKLSRLTSDPYLHYFFVDGQLAARKYPGRSVLVGTLGGGGMALFGLDIGSVPTSESSGSGSAASKVLWEITNATAGFANLGHTMGTPVLTNLPDGTPVLLVANGYNNGGNGHSSLFLINPITGAKIDEIDAGSPVDVASPNGLSSPTAVEGVDGRTTYAYAGDINGTMWKFDLAARSATALATTSPAQAITMAPAYKVHPNGGNMVLFATGRIFTAADAADTSLFYAYGIWDRPGAYASNDTLVTQTLGETTYGGARVRTATTTQPNWNVGRDMGWRVALPTSGERVVGDGALVSDSAFVFVSTNPTIVTSLPHGANWWMQLDAMTGGAPTSPRFDLNGDGNITSVDQVNGANPAGRHMGGGNRSQLTTFVTASNEIYLGSYDVNSVPPFNARQIVERGVAGGHFDFDNYYGKIGGARATAKITVGSSGQASPFPATLGAIKAGTTVLVTGLTVADVNDGTAAGANAATIAAKINAGGTGYSASASANVVTVTAPDVGTAFNTTVTADNGTSQTLVPYQPAAPAVPGTAPAPGHLVINDVGKNHNDVWVKCGGAYVTLNASGSPGNLTSIGDPKAARLDDLFDKLNGKTANGYAWTCSKGGSPTSYLDCFVAAPIGASACTAFADNQITQGTNVGPSGGSDPIPATPEVPQSGWTNFKPALTLASFTGGVNAVGSDICTNADGTNCGANKHVHEYDDTYDRTGVNMLDASLADFNLVNAIPATTTNFKVLLSNQYLSPAATLHLNGIPSYVWNVNQGYTPARSFMTTASLDVTTLPTYSRNTLDTTGTDPLTGATIPVYALRSLVINLPVTAFSVQDWWGNGDLRTGLHPTQTGCVHSSGGSDGNMFQPVIPYGTGDAYSPAIANVPTYGLSGTGTTPATSRGVRHNGALTLQVIRADTPQSAVEISVPGHPEYGWRLKSAAYKQYLLAEYTTFWHHPNKACYGDTTWVKDPPKDTATSTKTGSVAGTDPKIGSLGTGPASGVTLTPGTTTTTTREADGSTTTTTTTIVDNGNGTYTVTTSSTNSYATANHRILEGGVASSPTTLNNNEIAPLAPVGRVNWRELRK